jgi:hypothetical protein
MRESEQRAGTNAIENDLTLTARPPRRKVLSRAASAFAVLMLVTGAASAAGPAAAREGARVPSADDCRTLVARSPAPAARPVQLPAEARLTGVVANFVESAPSDQRYVFPTAAQRAQFQCGFQYAAAGRLVSAAGLLQPFQYDVKQLGNASTPAGKRFVVLEERKSRSRDGIERYRRAWGLYVIATRTRVPVVAVEVPHPCRSTARCNEVGGDRRTHTMAVTTFERAGAKYLFVAGTDRGATAIGCPQRPCSADVAHEEASMFEGVHEIALVPSRSLLRAAARVVQPHGFVTTSHPASCQEVVVSAGLAQEATRRITTTRLARRIAAHLDDDPSDVYRGHVLLYGRDEAPPPRRVDCSPQDDPTGGLGATTNVQGRFAARLDPPRDFVSVESSQNVRNVSAERDALSRTIGDVIGAP